MPSTSQPRMITQYDPLGKPRMVREQDVAAYTFIKNYPLPDDLKIFLPTQQKVEIGPGSYVFPAWTELPMVSIVVVLSGEATYFATSAYVVGYHEKATYSQLLTSDVLLWFPQLDRYGYYNRHKVYTYPQTNWTDIVTDLPAYFLTRSGIEKLSDDLVARWFYPVDMALHTLAQEVEETQPKGFALRPVIVQVEKYSRALLTTPYNYDLNGPYQALIKLFHYLSLHAEEDQALYKVKGDILALRQKAHADWLEEHGSVLAKVFVNHINPFIDEYLLFKRRSWLPHVIPVSIGIIYILLYYWIGRYFLDRFWH